MSRIVIGIIIIIFICALFAGVALSAHADSTITIPLDKSYYCMASDVEAHLTKLEISDYRMGSTYSTTPLDKVSWVRLWYTLENHGDHPEEGYVQAEFVDNNGNTYQPDAGLYSPETVSQNATSSPMFIELPIQKGASVVTIRIKQGFDYLDFDVPQQPTLTPTPTAVPTATPVVAQSATVQPTTQSSGGSGGCLPFLPFAIISGMGGVGMVVNRFGMKK